jgi:hypothetical protein
MVVKSTSYRRLCYISCVGSISSCSRQNSVLLIRSERRLLTLGNNRTVIISAHTHTHTHTIRQTHIHMTSHTDVRACVVRWGEKACCETSVAQNA